MKPFALHIPQPCSEPWNAMAPRSDGRFCDRCQHTVADLTSTTDAELLALFSSGDAPHCARFDAAQLDRVLEPKRKRSGLLPIAAFTSLLAVACGTETIAQGTPVRLTGEVALRPNVTQVDTLSAPTDTLRTATGVPVQQPVRDTVPPPPHVLMGKSLRRDPPPASTPH